MKCPLYQVDTKTKREVCYITGESCRHLGNQEECTDNAKYQLRESLRLRHSSLASDFRRRHDTGVVGWLEV